MALETGEILEIVLLEVIEEGHARSEEQVAKVV
jgi:hypothetical protein